MVEVDIKDGDKAGNKNNVRPQLQQGISIEPGEHEKDAGDQLHDEVPPTDRLFAVTASRP